MCLYKCCRMANGVDLVQAAPEDQSDLGLYCLPRPVLSENLGSLRSSVNQIHFALKEQDKLGQRKKCLVSGYVSKIIRLGR